MIIVKKVNYTSEDFIYLCTKLEEEHINVIKEQRSKTGNCLNNLESFKHVFIAYDMNKPVGAIAAKKSVNGISEIGRVYVLPEYRKKGIASNLLKIAEETAINDGSTKLILDTYERFINAVKLYKSYGFKITNNYIKNSPYSICMEKIINVQGEIKNEK